LCEDFVTAGRESAKRKKTAAEPDREGVSLWRRVGDALIAELGQGLLAPGERLPSEPQLAKRFGVARKTVRRALSHLQAEGLVRAERGRATFVTEAVLDFRIAPRTFMEQNLLESGRTPSRELVEVTEVPAPDVVAKELGVAAGELVLLVVVLGKADGVPLTMGRAYFPLNVVPKLADAFRKAGRGGAKHLSTAEVLESVGVGNLRRRTMRLRARQASPEEGRLLALPAGEYIIETEVVAIAGGDGLVMYSKGYYGASRVEFVIGPEMFEPVRPRSAR
jgi:GntR family phosphonate transport system transcriptional regulator